MIFADLLAQVCRCFFEKEEYVYEGAMLPNTLTVAASRKVGTEVSSVSEAAELLKDLDQHEPRL